MFFSEKTFWLCRRVISARRGCFQLPGLSVAACIVVCLTGVDAVCASTEDDMALRLLGKSRFASLVDEMEMCSDVREEGTAAMRQLMCSKASMMRRRDWFRIRVSLLYNGG